MDECLKKYDGSSETLVLLKLPEREKFICTDYEKLVQILVKSLHESDFNHGLLVDWTRCLSHTIVFDIDVENSEEEDTYDLLMNYFEVVFLNALKNHFKFCLPSLTVVVSMRRDRSGGMHVHLPGLCIGHDDYVHLCNLMIPECKYRGVTLDCPSAMCLVACDKPGGQSLYVPIRMVRIQFTPQMENLVLFDEDNDPLPLNEFDTPLKIATSYMMPVENPKNFPIRLFYQTEISIDQTNCVAYFTSNVNERKYFLTKKNHLYKNVRRRYDEDFSYAHRFLKWHADSAERFTTWNRVLKTWFKRYSSEKDSGFLGYINRHLRHKCVHLRNETNPLRTILFDSGGRFRLPVFYALCNLKKRHTSDVIAAHLNDLCGMKLFCLKEIPKESNYLTFDTILYCAFHTVPQKTKEGIFLQYIGKGWDWVFDSTKTITEMKDHIKFVQSRFFPIVKGLNPVSEKENLYTWDPFIEQWCKLEDEFKIEKVIECVFHHMKYFDGYSKLAKNIRDQLEEQTDWIRSIFSVIRFEVRSSKAINGNVLKTMHDYHSMYGTNIPQYYFFEANFHSDEDY